MIKLGKISMVAMVPMAAVFLLLNAKAITGQQPKPSNESFVTGNYFGTWTGSVGDAPAGGMFLLLDADGDLRPPLRSDACALGWPWGGLWRRKPNPITGWSSAGWPPIPALPP